MQDSNITIMLKEDIDKLDSERTTHKLKFAMVKDFWVFVGKMTTSSIRTVDGEHWPKI